MPQAAREDRRPALTALTGARSFAAIATILGHTQLFIGTTVPVFRHGYLGVDFFFMLSGFVLSYVHAEEMRQPNWRLYGRFLALRLGRIWPAYLVVLLAIGVATAWRERWWLDLPTPEQVRFIIHIFMLQSWGLKDMTGFNPPAWSVSAEWFVYFLFPGFVFCLLRANRIAALLAIPLLVALFALYCLVMGYYGVGYLGWQALPRAILEFAIGFLLWRLYCDAGIRRWNWQAIGIACVLMLLVLLALAKRESMADLLFVLLLAPLVLSLAFSRGPLAWICAWRPVVFLGEVSYSVYLVHFPILLLVAKLLVVDNGRIFSPIAAAVVLVGVTITVSIILGIGLHFIVERPCRRWVRHRLGYAA